MNFIYKNGERRQLANKIAQLIGLLILIVVTVIKQVNLSALFLYSVEDDFLCVCYRYKPKQLRERLMIRDFLNIWVFGLVRFAGGLGLVEDLEDEQSLYFGCSRLWQHPGRLKALYRSEAGHDRGFQPGRCKDHKVMRKGPVVRLHARKVQV